MAFVIAHNNETGEAQRVPEHWLGDGSHPEFQKFTKTQRPKAPGKPAKQAATNDKKES